MPPCLLTRPQAWADKGVLKINNPLLKPIVGIFLVVGIVLAIVGVLADNTPLLIVGDVIVAVGILLYLPIRSSSKPGG